jgi:hypothetical protein
MCGILAVLGATSPAETREILVKLAKLYVLAPDVLLQAQKHAIFGCYAGPLT